MIPRGNTIWRRGYLWLFPRGGRDFWFRLQRLKPWSSLRVIRDFDGDLRMTVDPSELMGFNLWYDHTAVEARERELFLASITPGCVVLDVGANLGMYTLIAAKRGATVFSVEADPKIAEVLRSNIAANRLANVKVLELAASDHEHRVALRRDPENWGATALVPGDSVRACAIDSLRLPPIDVCKMDIEGSELAALAGMRQTIGRSPGIKMLIECNHLSDQQRLRDCLKDFFSGIEEIPGSRNLWCWNRLQGSSL